MNINDKLEHFMSVSIKSADQQHNQLVVAYKAELDRIFEDHKTEALRKAALSEKIAIENIKRATQKDFSHEQVAIKRALSVKLDQLKDNLFEEVNTLLHNYKQTDAYYDLLLAQVEQALRVAKDDEITIYIDPEDQIYLDRLCADSGFNLTVSGYSFLGGTRAVIPSKNILIDNSFKTKLAEARENINIQY